MDETRPIENQRDHVTGYGALGVIAFKRPRVVLWLAAVLCCWASSSAASAQSAPASTEAGANDNMARGLFQAGTAAYEAGKYQDALQFYEQAYERSPRPQLLFNIGQAADRLREDDKALWAFRAYLANAPKAANRAEVQQRVDALEAHRSKTVEPARSPTVSQPPPTPPSAGAQLEVQPLPTYPYRGGAPTPAQAAAQSEAARPAPTQLTTEPSNGGRAVEPAQPITKRWWFWTGLGAVVVGGTAVALAVALGGGGAAQASPYQGNGASLRAP